MSFVGRVYDGGPVRLEVVATGEETGGEHHEMRATYAVDSPLPPAHLHPGQAEEFRVLEGALTFVVEGEECIVRTGEHLEVPGGAVHQVRNAGDVPAVAVWVTRPALRTAEFHDAIHTATAAQDWDGLRAALQEYRDVFRMVPDPFADA